MNNGRRLFCVICDLILIATLCGVANEIEVGGYCAQPGCNSKSGHRDSH